MKILVKVTKDILERSRFCATTDLLNNKVGQNCAIGLAIFDLFGNNSWVSENAILFFINGIKFTQVKSMFSNMDYSILDKEDYQFTLPEEVTEFIKRFDSSTPDERLNMKLISFEIDVPNEVIDQIGIGQAYKVLSESKTLELVSI